MFNLAKKIESYIVFIATFPIFERFYPNIATKNLPTLATWAKLQLL